MNKTRDHKSYVFLAARGAKLKKRANARDKQGNPPLARKYEQVSGDYVCSEETDHMYLYIGCDSC